jgi:hypothetical protein
MLIVMIDSMAALTRVKIKEGLAGERKEKKEGRKRAAHGGPRRWVRSVHMVNLNLLVRK